MTPARILDSPVSWAVAGLAIGLSLGVTVVSMWLVVAAMAAFVGYLRLHGPAEDSTETRLFAAGPVFLLSWLVGFVVRGVAF